MKTLMAPLALLSLSPAVAQETPTTPALTAQQSASLRCSAAFAMMAMAQQSGDEAALEYPPLAERGREFFVRSAAELMDELRLDRQGIEALVSAEAQRLWDEDSLEDVMPACMLMLEASGL